jgi:hypothetical protein
MSPGNSTVDMSARFVFRNLAEIKRDLDKWDGKRRPVAETAIRVELFRLRKTMQSELRQGQIAGAAFTPLRVVSRGTRASKKPLSSLAVAVRYNVEKQGDKTHMSVGFDGPQSSKAWRRIAHRVQEGGEIDADMHVFGSTLKKLWRRIGGDYKKGRGKTIAKYFFLRKDTTRLQVPGRKIIEPFWDKNSAETEKNIVSNFERKMRGERI